MQRGSQVIDSPPAPVDQGGGGGGWAWLLTARGIIEAELVRGVLESAGVIPVALDGRDPSPGAWMFLSGNVNALVRVFVPASQLDSARLVLLEAGFEQPAPPPPAPPPARAHRLSGRLIWLVITAVVIAIFLVATMHARVT
jgi:Putative prokaryotic signal transducing protein